MSDWLHSPLGDRRRRTISPIWAALALSLCLHIAALLVWPRQFHLLSEERLERGPADGPLTVELAAAPEAEPAPPPTPAVAPAPQMPPRASVRAAPPTSAAAPTVSLSEPLSEETAAAAPAPDSPPPDPAAPAIVTREPAPSETASPPATAVPSPPAAAASAPPPRIEGDLSSYIEARRRARGEVAPAPAQPRGSTVAPPREDDAQRRDRIIAFNLGQRSPDVRYDPRGAGGVFQIQRVGYDSAEFVFFGWNPALRRSSPQLIEVTRGDSGDIRVAIVRRMIAIIRADESADFMWVSERLGRTVVLSARPVDTTELERFLMLEFFGDTRRRN